MPYSRNPGHWATAASWWGSQAGLNREYDEEGAEVAWEGFAFCGGSTHEAPRGVNLLKLVPDAACAGGRTRLVIRGGFPAPVGVGTTAPAMAIDIEVKPSLGNTSAGVPEVAAEPAPRVIEENPFKTDVWRTLEFHADVPDDALGLYDITVTCKKVTQEADPDAGTPEEYEGVDSYVMEKVLNVLKIELVGIAEDQLGAPDVDNHPELFTRVLDMPLILPSNHITSTAVQRKAHDAMPEGGITTTWTGHARSRMDLGQLPDFLAWTDAVSNRDLLLEPSTDARVDYADPEGTTGIDLPAGLALDPDEVDQFTIRVYYAMPDPGDVPADIEVMETTVDSEVFTYITTVARTSTLPKYTPADDSYPAIPSLYRMRIRVTDTTVDALSLEVQLESVRDGEHIATSSLTLVGISPHVYESGILVGHSGYALSQETKDEFPGYTFVPASSWAFRIYKKFILSYVKERRYQSLPLRFYTPFMTKQGPSSSAGHDPLQYAGSGYYQPSDAGLKDKAVANLFPGPLVCPADFPIAGNMTLDPKKLGAKKAEVRGDVQALKAVNRALFYTPVYPGRPTILLAELGGSGEPWREGWVEDFEDVVFEVWGFGTYSKASKKIVWSQDADARSAVDVEASQVTETRGKITIKIPPNWGIGKPYDIVLVKFGAGTGPPGQEIVDPRNVMGQFAVVLINRPFRVVKSRVVRVYDKDDSFAKTPCIGEPDVV